MNTSKLNQPAVIRTFLFVSAVYLLSMPALAAESPMKLTLDSFSQFDSNRDGYIDSKEATGEPEVMKILRTADKDKDGKLSAAEFATGLKSAGSY